MMSSFPKAVGVRNGSCTNFPEMTMLSFRQGVTEGASIIQIPIRITSDNVPVCIHDTTVDRTTNGTGTISALTWSYISGLDAGYKFKYVGGSTYPYRDQGLTVPRLSDVFDEFKGQDVFLQLNISLNSTNDRKLITNLIATKGVDKQVIIFSSLTSIKKYFNSGIKNMITVPSESVYTPYTWETVIKNMYEAVYLKYDILPIWSELITKTMVDWGHALGKPVAINVIGMEAGGASSSAQAIKMQTCIDMGIDIFIVHDSAACTPVFEANGLVQNFKPSTICQWRGGYNFN